MGLLHVLGQFHGLDFTVTRVIDFADADFFALVDGEVDADGAADNGIPHHLYVYIGLQIALFLEVALDNVYRGIFHVIRIFAAGTQVQALLEVLPFAGFDAAEGPAGNTGPLADADFEPGGIRRHVERIHHYGHILKIALGHQAFYDTGNILSGNGKFLPGAETGELQDLVLVEIAVALHADTAHHIFLGMVIIDLNAPAYFLRPRKESREEQSNSAKYLFQTHSTQKVILQR